MIVIGIDPSKGIARADSTTGRLVSVETTDFWTIVGTLRGLAATVRGGTDTVLIYIEAPQINKPTFYHGQTNHRVRERISQNVGSNKRDAVLLIELCRLLRLPVIQIPPRRRNATKNSPENFCALTGWVGRTSEHGRDAAMIFWGRSWVYDYKTTR